MKIYNVENDRVEAVILINGNISNFGSAFHCNHIYDALFSVTDSASTKSKSLPMGIAKPFTIAFTLAHNEWKMPIISEDASHTPGEWRRKLNGQRGWEIRH